VRVFVTGGTGYVGSAVVRALVQGGHRVASLSRSPDRDTVVEALGAEPVRGSLPDLPRLAGRLAEHDALVHVAMDYGLGPPADRAAVEALLGAARAAKAPRLVVYTSGVWVLGETSSPAGEDASTARPAAAVAWRPAHEKLVLDAASGSLATAVVRPGIVWGEKRGLFIGFMESARKGGAAAHVGPGTNRWPPVHREDLAALYRLLVERRARGVYHGVDGTAPRVAEMARALSEAAGAKGATRSVPLEEARKTMGPMADALATDQVVLAPRSAELGWKPSRPSFPEAAKVAFQEWTR
jgi:nucleoside-diphosphate-sugar epimerase